MIRREIIVKSFTFTEETLYAECHLNYPLMWQLRRIKKSLVASKGRSISLFLDEFADVRIDYSGALTIFSDPDSSEVFSEFCYGVESSIINYPSALNEFRSKLVHNLAFKNAITCIPGGGYNLHHFLFEILPSLLVFKGEIQKYDALILGSTPGSTFLAEINELLGITQNLILVPVNSSLRISNLANITAVPFRIYPVEMIYSIRSLILDKCDEIPERISPVVFIGRQDNDRNRRVLVNESSLLNSLSSIYDSIEVVRPGITKISETVKVVRGAKVLIGPTGGNLAHLIWASELELFIEIVPVDYPGHTETEELSRILGFNYIRLDSDSVSNQDWVYSDQECRLENLESDLRSKIESL